MSVLQYAWFLCPIQIKAMVKGRTETRFYACHSKMALQSISKIIHISVFSLYLPSKRKVKEYISKNETAIRPAKDTRINKDIYIIFIRAQIR